MKKGFITALALSIMVILLPMAVSADANRYVDSVITQTTFADGKYTVSPGTLDDGSVIIFGAYNGTSLAYADYRTYDASGGDAIEFTVPDTVEYDSAKVFAWNNMADMQPLGNPELIKVSKITPETELVVVYSVSTGITSDINNKGELCNYLQVYNSNGEEYFEVVVGVTLPELTRGDVAVIGMNSAGRIVEVEKLYTIDNSQAAVDAIWAAEKATNPITLAESNHFIRSGIDAWDNTDKNDEVWTRVGFGIILDRNGDDVVMASVKKATEAETAHDAEIAIGDNISVDDLSSESDVDNVETFHLSDDVNIYVYDYNSNSRNRITNGSISSIIQTFMLKELITSLETMKIYKWASYETIVGCAPSYAFYKVTNGEITDIVVIIPYCE